ncbi:MAG: sensor histidine kinase [Lachnospira sp.]
MPDFNNMAELNIGLLLFSALVSLLLLIGVLSDSKNIKTYMKRLVLLLIINILMNLGEAGIWVIGSVDGNRIILDICCVLSYGGGAAMMLVYSYCLIDFISERKKVSYSPVYVMAGICAVYFILIIISMFNGMIYHVDNQGLLSDGPFEYFSWVLDAVMLVTLCLIVIYYRKYISRREMWCLLSFSLLSLPTTAMKTVWYPVPEFLSATLAIILIFLLFHKEMNRQLVEKERQLIESRLAIAISQIQPHFIYNTLSTIGELCQRDPAMAEEVTTKFALYLRGNLNHMENTLPVSFSKELQHIKTYLWIEKMRFGDDLNIVYDIMTEDFNIPSLSVQPIVENAVKHGMMGSNDVCTIIISTCEKDDGYEIKIADDGEGFDMTKPVGDDKIHVGLENVRRRLELMVNGTLLIDSHPGEGTCVVIFVPKTMN